MSDAAIPSLVTRLRERAKTHAAIQGYERQGAHLCDDLLTEAADEIDRLNGRKINMKIDLDALSTRLMARTNLAGQDEALVQLLKDAAEAAMQALIILNTLPAVIDNKRKSTVVETGANLAAAILKIADQYDEGALLPKPAGTALREVAASIAKSVMTPEEERGKAKKPRIIGLNS